MTKEKTTSLSLPAEFLARMEQMLGTEEYEQFLASYEKTPWKGIRFNTLKGREEDLLSNNERHLGLPLRTIPWAKAGYYVERSDTEELTPGKHPYHAAGVYYMQEPSAMAPADYLRVQPGERILDLCAAPGGKTTQIAAAMRGEGILFANEIHPARAKILSENVERMGISNAIVTSADPQTLLQHFGCFFQKILVDAPCSGEGMFRKNPEATGEWSLDNVRMCAKRQDEILDCAYRMLRPGGLLVYSTCTFAPDENEGSISRFCHAHPDMEIVQVPCYDGMDHGRADWYETFADHTSAYAAKEAPCAPWIEYTIRLFPHHLDGEGHYVAILRKQGSSSPFDRALREMSSYKKYPILKEFVDVTLSDLWKERFEEGSYLLFGEQLYLVPSGAPSLEGLKVLRPGLHVGTLKKNRFEPSHALALHLRPRDVRHVENLSSESAIAASYLRGETFTSLGGENGWYLITVDGYSVGWGKLTGTTMKNHYPKGLRG